MQPLEHDLSRDEIAFARDRFSERAQNGQCVLVGSPTGAPNVGDVLSEEGSKVRAVMVTFGRKPGLGAVWAGLGVRRTDRDVQGGVRLAKERK